MINCSIYRLKPTLGNGERPRVYAKNRFVDSRDKRAARRKGVAP